MGTSARCFTLTIYIDPDEWLRIPVRLKLKLRSWSVAEDYREPDFIRFDFKPEDRPLFMACICHLMRAGVHYVSEGNEHRKGGGA